MTLIAPGRHNVGGYRLANANVWQEDDWSRHTRKVQEWLREPPILDDGETPPTGSAIDSCMRRFAALQEARMPAPTRVMPNGEGGLIAEWVAGTRTTVMEINQDLSMEFTVLEQGMRRLRETFQPATTYYYFTA